jgi:hypothetical protein
MPKCPCEVTGESNENPGTLPARLPTLARVTNGHPYSPSGVASTSGHSNLLFNRSNQYERLISGQESEFGEAPPTYTPVELYPVVNHADA